MRLTITNKSRSSVAVGGRVGTLRPNTVTTLTLTIAELEALRTQFTAMESAGLIEWDTVPTTSTQDDPAEGATIAYVDAQAGGGGALAGDVTGDPAANTVEGIWNFPIPQPGGQGNEGLLRFRSFPQPEWSFLQTSIDSGVYASTGVVGANVSAVTPAEDFPYMLIGNTVSIGGVVDVTVNGAGASAFRLTMPFANFASTNKAGGTAVGFDGTNYVMARIKSVFFSDRVEFDFTAPAAGTINFSFNITLTLG
jgi:hypothetical protein